MPLVDADKRPHLTADEQMRTTALEHATRTAENGATHLEIAMAAEHYYEFLKGS